MSTIIMLIKKTWALVSPPSRIELLASDNLRILKFVQLAMSKTLNVSIKESTGVSTRANGESELGKKVTLVHNTISYEIENINTLNLRMQAEWFQLELLDSSKEFIDTIGLNDSLVDATHVSERNELLRFQEYCQAHKSFVFKTLHNIDYSQEYTEIKNQLIKLLSLTEPDSKFISAELSTKLMQQIKND